MQCAQVVEERVENVGPTTSSLARVYTYGSSLISQTTSGTGCSVPATRYYAYDGGNTVRELTDETGTITDRYDYDAFGNLVYRAGTTTNAYLYRSEQYDADLGLYFLRARYLNPDSGRFWSQDTYQGRRGDPVTLHKYLYAHANPVMGRDPTGHWTLMEVSVTMGISALINVALAVPTIRFGEESIEDIGKKLGVAAIEGAVTGIIGGVAGKVALKAFPQVKWLLARGAIAGGGGGAAAQLAKEFYEVVFNGKPVSIKDSAGRVFIATVVGIGIGGATFKIQPLVEKVLHPTVPTPQGFQQTVHWLDVTREQLSPSGVAGALGAEAATSVIADWIESGLDLDSE